MGVASGPEKNSWEVGNYATYDQEEDLKILNLDLNIISLKGG